MTPNKFRLEAALVDQLGLALDVQVSRSPEGLHVDLRPTDVHANEGFSVRTTLGWRHVIAQLRVGSFAKEILRHMEASTHEQRKTFAALASTLSTSGGRITFQVNGSPTDMSDVASWPHDWQTIRLEAERTPLLINHEDETSLEDTVVMWGGTLMGMAVALLPVEEIRILERTEIIGLPEGAKQTVVVNRYERNPINRLLCISAQGTNCSVCGFDFAAVFGDVGRGYIHVHHIVPVSKLGPNYVIDPLKDLVPVCANCHAMLHRRDPPFSVEELKQEMSRQHQKF